MRELLNSFRQDALKIPNILTELRLLLCPLPGILLITSGRYSAVIAFALIAITDKLDGYLARRLNQVTKLGKTLDPIVDKWLIFCSLICLCIMSKMIIILVLFYFYYCLSLLFLFIRTDQEILPTSIGKANMFIQCVIIGILMLPLHKIFYIFAMTISAVSMIISYKSYYDKYHTSLSGLK